jgi:ComF family protein
MFFNYNQSIRRAHQLVLFLADWLFPRECVMCAQEGEWLCATCRHKVGYLPRQVCLICQADKEGMVCVSHNLFIDRFFSAFSYRDDVIEYSPLERDARRAGCVKQLVKLFKYHFSREAGDILAGLLIDFLKADDQQKILRLLNHWSAQNKLLVLAVPLSKRRERWRGFNQAKILANQVADGFVWRFDNKNLIRIKHNKPQAELTALARRNNLTKSFVWQGESLSGFAVLLIDDVATTGTTLNECARALKASGASKVYGLTIAHG